MENKVSDKNLAYIEKYNKQLFNKILMTDLENSNLQLSKTNSDEYNLVFNNVELHSAQGALAEAQNIANKVTDDFNSLKIIYGLGLGYLPDTVSKKCTKSKIVIYEPNLDIIKLVLSIAQIDALYQNNVFLVSDNDEFSTLLKKIITPETDLSIVFLNSYKTLFYNNILDVFQKAQDIQAEVIGNRNTYIEKMPNASRETLFNLKKIIKSPNIEQLKDIYKNKTALILCAGPSLETNIETIKQNQDKFITFALNPSLKLLKKYSIIPDFIISIDVIDNQNQFEGIDLLNSYFITDAFTHSCVVRRQAKKHFFYISNENFFNYWVRRSLKIENNLKTLGTSSYTALCCAILMGFSKIIFIGQDLSFKGGKCYSSGGQYESLECVFNKDKKQYEIITNDFEAFKNSYKTIIMDDNQAISGAKNYLKNLNKNLRTTKDVNGNLIPTKADYLTFIKLFEDFAKTIKDVELINSSNGANIKGFKNINLKDALNNSDTVEKLDITSYEPNYDIDNFKKELDILYKSLLLSCEILKEYNSACEKLLKELEVKKTFTQNIVKLIEKQKNLFNRLLEQFKNQDTGNILSSFAYNIFELLKTDYYQNPNMLVEALKKIIPSFKRMEFYLEVYYLPSLADCKTLIL
ncbi:MAG: motility associated factor glycosyltransferase family protein [Candidatus Gastranaerophilales bacterium]|nr:motility associated factor glycosyltransferase family protein [Candidatus Gastranaerophilales bacterium]